MWFLNTLFFKKLFFWNVDKRINKRIMENQRSFIKHMNATILKLQKDCETLEHRHDLDIARIDAKTQRLNTYGYIFRDAIYEMGVCIARYPIVKDYLQNIINTLNDRQLSCESTAIKQIFFLLTCLNDHERENLELKLKHDHAMAIAKAFKEECDKCEDEDEKDEKDEYGNFIDEEGNEA